MKAVKCIFEQIFQYTAVEIARDLQNKLKFLHISEVVNKLEKDLSQDWPVV